MKNVFRAALTVLFLFLSPFARAHPPSSIDLQYNLPDKILHIEIKHVTHDPREHHIRKILISVNSGEPQVVYLSTQTTPAYDSEDISLEAKEGDLIRVEAVCSDAGRLEATLTVPESKQ